MKDIFGVDKTVYGIDQIVPAAGVLLAISGTGDNGQPNTTGISLVQSVNLQYARQVNTLYTLGSENVYAGSTGASGTLEATRAVSAKTKLFSSFLGNGNNACQGQDLYIQSANSTCGGKLEGTLQCSNSVLQNIGLQAQAGNYYVTESASWWVGGVSGGA